MTPVPKDHPLRIAWDLYQSTEDYANNLRWAETAKVEVTHPNTVGSLWGAFMEGYKAGSGVTSEQITAYFQTPEEIIDAALPKMACYIRENGEKVVPLGNIRITMLAALKEALVRP